LRREIKRQKDASEDAAVVVEMLGEYDVERDSAHRSRVFEEKEKKTRRAASRARRSRRRRRRVATKRERKGKRRSARRCGRSSTASRGSAFLRKPMTKTETDAARRRLTFAI